MFPQRINSFKEIVDRYEVFVFDLWGVLHNGVVIYDQTLHFIEYLRTKNKKITYLSNTPRPSSLQVAYFANQGFALPAGEQIVTSGDFFRFCFQQNADNMFVGKKIFNLGAELNADLLSGLDVQYAVDIPSADFIIISLFVDNESSLGQWDAELKLAIQHSIPAICANPDVNVPHGDHIRYTPGTFAQRYSEFGGEVYYYGKPYPPIYNYVIDKLLHTSCISKDQTLFIGDSLATDIKGANNYGIDSLLLLSGVHAEINPDSDAALQQLFSQFEAVPTFFMTEPNFD